MKKLLVIIGVMVLLALIASGAVILVTGHKNKIATTTTSGAQASTQKAIAPGLTVSNATTKLEAAGLTVGAPDSAYYQTIGAINGNKVVVNGTVTVEFYQFNRSTAQTAALTQLAASGITFSNGDMLVLIDATDGTGNPVDPSLSAKIKAALQ